MSLVTLSKSVAHAIALLTLAAPVYAADLFVSSTNTSQVIRYDGDTGTLAGVFAGGGELGMPVGLAFGPDKHLYVASLTTREILRYNGATGAFMGVFASNGGLSEPSGLAFGPDGHLYVSDRSGARVLRYNGSTGAFMGQFANGGGLADPLGLAFGPDGDLYVGGAINNQVLHYDGGTGAFVGVFASGGGLSGPAGLVFGPDRNLYVSSSFSNQVLRYDGTTGAFVDVFVPDSELRSPYGLAFGLDGSLYVSSAGSGQVRRYDGGTGAFVDVFADGDALDFPTYLAFAPPPSAPQTTDVGIDIQPGSCPNVVNAADRSFQVAILGGASFDVRQIDVTTVRLEGLTPIRSASVSDVSSPARSSRDRHSYSGCGSRRRDGIKDLVVQFDPSDLVRVLGLDDDEPTVLRLTGNLKAEFGGTAFAGEDVVVVKNRRNCRSGRH